MSDFNVNKISLRIFFASVLLDKDGRAQKFENGDDVILPQGAKVVFLELDENDKHRSRILCYWKEKYWDGYIASNAVDRYNTDQGKEFGRDYDEINKNSFEVFLNDVDHLLNNRLPLYNCSGELKFLLENTQRRFETIKSKQNITENTLHVIRNRYYDRTSINVNQKVKSLNSVLDLLYKHFNRDFKESVTIFPLSIDWFNSNKELAKFYSKDIASTNVGINQMFEGEVGELHSGEAELYYIYMYLVPKLKTIVNSEKINDYESNWLLKLDTKKLFNNMVTTISFGDKTWAYSPEIRIVKKGFVPLNSIYGPFRLHPFTQLVIHEMIQAGYADMPLETHIIPSFGEHSTKLAIEKYIQNGGIVLTSYDTEQTQIFADQIYQDSSALSLININILFSLFY